MNLNLYIIFILCELFILTIYHNNRWRMDSSLLASGLKTKILNYFLIYINIIFIYILYFTYTQYWFKYLSIYLMLSILFSLILDFSVSLKKNIFFLPIPIYITIFILYSVLINTKTIEMSIFTKAIIQIIFILIFLWILNNIKTIRKEYKNRYNFEKNYIDKNDESQIKFIILSTIFIEMFHFIPKTMLYRLSQIFTKYQE